MKIKYCSKHKSKKAEVHFHDGTFGCYTCLDDKVLAEAWNHYITEDFGVRMDEGRFEDE